LIISKLIPGYRTAFSYTPGLFVFASSKKNKPLIFGDALKILGLFFYLVVASNKV